MCNVTAVFILITCTVSVCVYVAALLYIIKSLEMIAFIVRLFVFCCCKLVPIMMMMTVMMPLCCRR